MTTTSAPASRASSAVAAPIPEAPPTTTARLPSYRNASNRLMSSSPPIGKGSSGHDATDLQVHDRVPLEAELAEDRVAVLVELRRPPRDGRPLVELDRWGDEPEGNAGGGLALLHIPVRDCLRIGDGLERVLHDCPLAAEVGEPPPPLLERRRHEDVAQDLAGGAAVREERRVVGKPR